MIANAQNRFLFLPTYNSVCPAVLLLNLLGKGKGHPITCALDKDGWSTPSPGRFTSGHDTVYIAQEAVWDPGPVSTGDENFRPTEIQSPDRPSCSKSLYRLRYPHQTWTTETDGLLTERLSSVVLFFFLIRRYLVGIWSLWRRFACVTLCLQINDRTAAWKCHHTSLRNLSLLWNFSLDNVTDETKKPSFRISIIPKLSRSPHSHLSHANCHTKFLCIFY
jgi:hypothetical protein